MTFTGKSILVGHLQVSIGKNRTFGNYRYRTFTGKQNVGQIHTN